MVLAAGFRYYNVLSVIFAKQCCIIHPVKEYLVLYNVCIELFNFKMRFEGPNWQIYENAWGRSLYFPPFLFFLQLYLSHRHKKYVKQQVLSCFTTLVYHSHIEKCDLGVKKLNKLNTWRPFWKISCNLFSSPN